MSPEQERAFDEKFPPVVEHTLHDGDFESDYKLMSRTEVKAHISKLLEEERNSLAEKVEKLLQPDLEHVSIEGRSCIAGNNSAVKLVLAIIRGKKE